VVTVFTIPWIVGLSMANFLGGDAEISLPFWKTLAQLIVVTILPIALGMALRSLRKELAMRLERPANVVSVLFLAAVIAMAVVREDDLAGQFRQAGPAAVALNLLAMGLSFLAAWAIRLPRRQQVTISIEAGIQNGTLALAIALGLLNSANIAMPAVVYSLFMFATGAAMILVFGWWKGREVEAGSGPIQNSGEI
jgi:BASS family bile acid:Na+ symporter